MPISEGATDLDGRMIARVSENGGKKPVQKSSPRKNQVKGHGRPFSSLLKESQDRLANIHRLLDAATEETLFAPPQEQAEKGLETRE